jgi:hypothetical protein
MKTKNVNITTPSGEWYLHQVPLVLLKHRVVKTDPTYKFVINADIYVRSNVAVRQPTGSSQQYYDLLNILAPQDSSITGSQWLNFINSQYDILFVLGENYNSEIFPEISFDNLEDRDLFDTMYLSLNEATLSDGISSYIDFSISISKGFINNKLGLNIDRVQPWIMEKLSFNLLTNIVEKSGQVADYKIKPSSRNALSLSNDDILLIETLTQYNSPLVPRNDDGISYIWNYLNSFALLNSPTTKGNLFNFAFDKFSIVSISNKDFSLDVDSNNYPMNIKTNNIINENIITIL